MIISPTILTTLAIVSAIMFIGSLFLIPVIIIRLSNDYFQNEEHLSLASNEQKSTSSFLIQIVKNLLGVIFILVGIAMLILPGQGILTILIGLGITNFPGKYKLERKLVKNQSVFKSLNWIRKRADVDPFLYPK